MKRSILLICTVLACALLGLVEAAPASTTKWKCTPAEEEQVDKMIAKAIIIGTGDKFPVDKTSMKKFCSSTTKTVTKIETYKDACMKGSLKQAMSVLLFSVKAVLSSHCKNLSSKKTKEFWTATPCLNEASSPLKQCHDITAKHFASVEKDKDSKKKLSQLCCSYVEFIKCVQVKMPKFATCNEKAIGVSVNFVKSVVENTINLICGEYNDQTDKCDNYAFVNSKEPLKYHSFLAPAIHIVGTL